MTQYFLRSVGGNWDGASTWSNSSGGAANGLTPTAAIDCVCDAASSTATLTINGTSGSPSLCRSLVCTGFTGTLTHTSLKQLNIGDGTAGNLTFVSGMTYGPNSDSLINFVSTTGTNNITTAGKRVGSFTFDGVGGTWSLSDACDSTSGAIITLTNGTLNTNNQAVGATSGAAFSSNNSNTRALTLGTTTWTVRPSTGTQWDIGTSTGMTLSAASSTLSHGLIATGNVVFNGGGLTYGTMTSTSITTGSLALNQANTFSTLTLSIANTAKSKTSGYALAANQTVTGTFTAAGNSAILRNFIYSDTMGTARTITAATVTVTNTDFRDITGGGAGSWNFSGLTSNANGDGGNNTGMTFTAPKNCYLVVNAAAAWSASNWKTTSGGAVNISPVMPLLQDFAIIDSAASFSVTRNITLDQPRLPSNNWTGAPNTPTFTTSTIYELYGSMTLISGMTHVSTPTMTYVGRGSSTLDGGTLTWPTSSTIIIDAAIGTLTLASNLTSNAGWTMTSGTWAQGGFTSSWGAASSINGGTAAGTGAITQSAGAFTVAGGSITLGGTLTMAAGLTVSSGTLNMNGNNITGNTSFSVSGGVLNLSGQINGSTGITLSGGTVLDSGASGELKGSTMSTTGGTHAMHKFTLTSTFAISSTGSLTINPGVSTWVTSYNETGTTHSLTYNGTATNINGTLTVTAASAGGGGSFTFS